MNKLGLRGRTDIEMYKKSGSGRALVVGSKPWKVLQN
jgi:hypothetical protein